MSWFHFPFMKKIIIAVLLILNINAVVVTHGLKVLGMGSMAVGIFSTCIIAVGTAYGVYKGMNYILERLD